MKMNRRADAAAELRKIRPGVDFRARLNAIETALRQEGGRGTKTEQWPPDTAKSPVPL